MVIVIITYVQSHVYSNNLFKTYYIVALICSSTQEEICLRFIIKKCSRTRADNEPNQLENSSRLDSIIDLLNLVHEPNESNLS